MTTTARRPKATAEPMSAAAAELHAGHTQRETQGSAARVPLAPGQEPCDAQTHSAGGNQLLGGHQSDEAPVRVAAELLFHAEFLNDIERLRIAAENRVRSATDGDPKNGVPPRPEFAFAGAEMVKALQALEHQSELAVKRAMRRHPLGPWAAQVRGLGEKQGGRLLAVIGDPLYNHAEDRPRRGPAEFWQYCGHGDPVRSRRRKGERLQHNPAAKMRTHLCAEAAVKAGVRKREDCDDTDGYDVLGREAISPLGQAYLDARAAWADREVSDGHKHNHALRMVGKQLLLDMFVEARRLAALPAAESLMRRASEAA